MVSIQVASRLVNLQFNLLFIVLPFAVAPQNIIQFYCVATGLILLSRLRKFLPFESIDWSFNERALAYSLLAWIILRIAVGFFSGNYGFDRAVQIFLGYLPMILIPWLSCKLSVPLNLQSHQVKRFLNAIVLISILWCLIAVSQRIVGWAFYGGQLNFEKFRAYGLYSHPLTLAYVLVLLTPLSLRIVVSRPNCIRSWLGFGSLVVVLILNESRTVQLVSLCVLSFIVAKYTSGRLRLALASGAVAVLVLISASNNPVREKFRKTYSEAALRLSRGEMPDDRVVFWKVHLNLARERPILGWGADIPDDFRVKAYNDAGYAQLKDKYNAHNLYLQALVEAGIFGLALLLIILYQALMLCRKISEETKDENAKLISEGAFFGLIAFAIASLTQNSIYDSEVRFAITLLLTVLALASKIQPSVQLKN